MNKTGKRLHEHDGVPGAAGVIAHAVVAQLLAEPELPSAAALTDRVSREVKAMTADLGDGLNGRRVFILAVTSAVKYLLTLQPVACRFLAAEVALDGTRPDLLWDSANSLVFFDELKTGRYLRRKHVQQALAQAEAGRQRFGNVFTGVRLVIVALQRDSLFVLPDGVVKRLSDTSWSFEALRPASGYDLEGVSDEPA